LPSLRPDKPEHGMFFFFSNRTGCLGSLAITAIGTLLLLLLLGWI
jgi:hypothetical protein